jgi:two-component system KDP operon response regulator KdpE
VSQAVIMPEQTARAKKHYGVRRDTMSRIACAIDRTDASGPHVPAKVAAPSQLLPIRGPSPPKFGLTEAGSHSRSGFPGEPAITEELRMSHVLGKVLIVDDEPSVRKLLRTGLGTQGYRIIEASDGKTALTCLSEEPKLIILDLGLPDMSGQELLQRIRAMDKYVSIVILSGRTDEVGKIQALDAGADDYLTKPFGMGELLARMRAALRHQMQANNESPVFRTGALTADFVRRIIMLGDREIKLTPKEYELLRVLAQHAGKVLTHRFLLGELWSRVTNAQYLRVYVRQLRRKIEIDPQRPQYLVTETGVGYRLQAPT